MSKIYIILFIIFQLIPVVVFEFVLDNPKETKITFLYGTDCEDEDGNKVEEVNNFNFYLAIFVVMIFVHLECYLLILPIITSYDERIKKKRVHNFYKNNKR